MECLYEVGLFGVPAPVCVFEPLNDCVEPGHEVQADGEEFSTDGLAVGNGVGVIAEPECSSLGDL